MLHDDDEEDDIDEEELVEIIEHDALNRSTIPIIWMDDYEPMIEFRLRRRPKWSDAEYDILSKELSFLKLNPNYITTSLE